MIPKSGYRFSDKILLNEDMPGWHCSPFIRSTEITSSGTIPLMLSAMRTRNAASERQNE